MATKTDEKTLVGTCFFKFKNETPGALRYEQTKPDGETPFTIAEGALVGTLYLRKSALNGAMPKSLKVDITINQ